jgi:hypothetical protein
VTEDARYGMVGDLTGIIAMQDGVPVARRRTWDFVGVTLTDDPGTGILRLTVTSYAQVIGTPDWSVTGARDGTIYAGRDLAINAEGNIRIGQDADTISFDRLPTSLGAPSLDEHLITKGYADATYTGGGAVDMASIAAAILAASDNGGTTDGVVFDANDSDGGEFLVNAAGSAQLFGGLAARLAAPDVSVTGNTKTTIASTTEVEINAGALDLNATTATLDTSSTCVITAGGALTLSGSTATVTAASMTVGTGTAGSAAKIRGARGATPGTNVGGDVQLSCGRAIADNSTGSVRIMYGGAADDDWENTLWRFYRSAAPYARVESTGNSVWASSGWIVLDATTSVGLGGSSMYLNPGAGSIDVYGGGSTIRRQLQHPARTTLAGTSATTVATVTASASYLQRVQGTVFAALGADWAIWDVDITLNASATAALGLNNITPLDSGGTGAGWTCAVNLTGASAQIQVTAAASVVVSPGLDIRRY